VVLLLLVKTAFMRASSGGGQLLEGSVVYWSACHGYAARIPTCVLPTRSYLGASSYSGRPAIIMQLYRKGSLKEAVRRASQGLQLDRALRWGGGLLPSTARLAASSVIRQEAVSAESCAVVSWSAKRGAWSTGLSKGAIHQLPEARCHVSTPLIL
jgi:hypothetical protein